MLRLLAVWWAMITRVGSGASLSHQMDAIFRYYVLEALKKEGLFEYLKMPRTYGQILAEFGYVDSNYTQELFTVLSKDKNNLVICQDGNYHLNPAQKMPQLGKLATQTSKRIQGFLLMAQGMAHNIPARLRNEPIELSDSFEQDGRQLLARFDKTLGTRIYSTFRDIAFLFLSPQERRWLRGKKLLNVGCGSGRETADIWLKLQGDVQITAIDSVPSMLELAKRNFAMLLDEMAPGHTPLTEANQPVFQQVSVTRMPFEDNSFDAVFHSLVLHWTPSPQKATSEIARVLKPGGLVFGTQATKPYLNPYFDLVIRTNENAYGFFWQKEFLRWYSVHGIEVETATPIGVFRGHKPTRPQISA